MKRLLLVIFAGLLLNAHVFAQYYGSEDEDYEDYSDAGTSDTINLSATNTGTEGYSEQKLTLPNNQPIYLYFYNTVQNPTPPETQAPDQAAAQPAAPPPREPEPLIEYRYVPAPAASAPPPEPIYLPPVPQIEYIYVQPPKPQVEYVYIQPPAPPQVEYVYLPPPEPQVEYVYLQPPQVEPIPPPPAEPVYIPSHTQIRVIPGLPNPDSSRVYRLQVGSYSAQHTAEKMAQRIRSAGLQAKIENYNSLKRVFVPSVRAADACSIVQMLELLGFQEVWVRE